MKTKKTLLLLILPFLFIEGIKAQISESIPIYVGFQFGPNFSYRVLSNNTDDSSVDDQINFLDNRETASLGYRGALTLGVQIFEQLSLEGGISYLRNSTDFELSAGDVVNERRGIVYDNTFDKGIIRTNLHYIGIPLRLTYTTRGEKIRLSGQFGLTPQILIDQGATYKLFVDNEKVESGDFPVSEDAAGFNVSPSLGIGIQYNLNERLVATGEVNARFGIININEDSPINSYVYSSELSVGLQYFIQ